MTRSINLSPLVAALKTPFIQELLADAKREGVISLIARLDVMLEEDRPAHELEALFDRRREYVAKYGTPTGAQVNAALIKLANDWSRISPGRLPAARRAYLAIAATYPASLPQ